MNSSWLGVLKNRHKPSLKRLFIKHLRIDFIISPMLCVSLRPLFALLLAAPLCVALPLSAAAAEQDTVRAGVAKGQYKSLSVILAEVAATHKGRVVDVETKRGSAGELRYAVKLVDAKGNKQELLIDAATGRTVQQSRQDRSQALSMTDLARYLAQLKLPASQQVTDVEYERDNQGRGVYQIKLSGAQPASGRLVMNASTGKLIEPVNASEVPEAQVKRVEEVLSALVPKFSGRVLEIELEHDKNQRPYYEIELLQNSGSTLELKVDAITLQVLGQKLED